MNDLKKTLEISFNPEIYKIILSKPGSKTSDYNVLKFSQRFHLLSLRQLELY